MWRCRMVECECRMCRRLLETYRYTLSTRHLRSRVPVSRRAFHKVKKKRISSKTQLCVWVTKTEYHLQRSNAEYKSFFFSSVSPKRRTKSFVRLLRTRLAAATTATREARVSAFPILPFLSCFFFSTGIVGLFPAIHLCAGEILLLRASFSLCLTARSTIPFSHRSIAFVASYVLFRYENDKFQNIEHDAQHCSAIFFFFLRFLGFIAESNEIALSIAVQLPHHGCVVLLPFVHNIARVFPCAHTFV